MNEHPILFTPDNIRAIIEGRKTQTRRVFRWSILSKSDGAKRRVFLEEDAAEVNKYLSERQRDPMKILCPYGQIGHRLYIKEGVIIHNDGRTLAGYYMDGARVTNLGESRRTAMFMPKWATRYWLEITDVRVEQLQEISDEDCFAEGIHRFGSTEMYGHNPKGTPGPLVGDTPKDAYRLLWDFIHRKKHPWPSNPWVWVLSFKKVEAK